MNANQKGDFIQALIKKSQTVVILGKRGSGKSALGFYLLEQLKERTDKQLCTVGFPKKTPFKNYDTIEEVPPSSIVLLDEGSIKWDARRSLTQENISMSNVLKIARHNEISTIFISQNSADIEVRTLRMADIFMLKEPSLVQEYFERSAIKRLYQYVKPAFGKIKSNHAPYYYIISDALEGLFQFPLPKFWTNKISKAHKVESNLVPELFNHKPIGLKGVQAEKKVLEVEAVEVTK